MKLLFILLSLFILSDLVHANSASVVQQQLQVSSDSVSEAEQYIAMSDVAKEASKIIVGLKEIDEVLSESKELLNLQESIKPYCESIDKLLASEKYKNIYTQNVRALQKMQAELQAHLKQLEEWETLINQNIQKYDKYREVLQTDLYLWKNTYNNALKNNAPKEVLTYIQTVVNDIKNLQKSLKKKYDKTLTDSQLVSSHILKINELLENIKEAENIAMNKVFYKNQPSLIEAQASENFSLKAYFQSIKNSIIEKYQETRNYFLINSEYWPTFLIVAFLSVLFVFYYNYLYRKKRLFVSKASIGRKIFFFIKRPFSTYVILFFLSMTFIFPDRPKSFAEIVLVLMIIPVVRILQSVLSKQYYKYLYTFFLIYIFYIVNLNATGFSLESRYVMLLVNLMLFTYIATLLYNRVLQQISAQILYKIGVSLLYIFLFILIAAFFANIYGSVLLSFRVINGVISVLYASMIFYALYIILTGYIVVILRRRISSISHMLDKYAQKIESTTMYLIKIWMILWWLLIVTKQLSLYPYLEEFIEHFLAFSIAIGETTISVQAIFDFIIIIVTTFLLAKLIRTILEIEVFARLRLPRGMPTAIITTLNYIIIIAGVFIAFSSLGVTTEQFALIFGALGVGIGFGLRNIIANFISGIIMVFERPIQIGDTIEIDNTLGSVQSIGARSSTVKTFDGSEVIIPNADFIAKEIINWTLSDKYRRKTVEFKVDLENDIEQILKIMHDVAVAHKDVLTDPEPLATFKGFGEYYLEFRLYFWLCENLIVAQSEVAIGIYKALKEAGVKMPVLKANFFNQEEESRDV